MSPYTILFSKGDIYRGKSVIGSETAGEMRLRGVGGRRSHWLWNRSKVLCSSSASNATHAILAYKARVSATTGTITSLCVTCIALSSIITKYKSKRIQGVCNEDIFST